MTARRTRVIWDGALAVLGWALLAASPATAGPPYVTDDPQPTDTAKWEIYGFGSGTTFDHGIAGESGFDVNYGGAKDLQLSAVISSAYQHDGGQPAHVGFADVELGAKYRFLHQRDGSWMPDVSLFPKIALPTAGARFGSGKVGLSIRKRRSHTTATAWFQGIS